MKAAYFTFILFLTAGSSLWAEPEASSAQNKPSAVSQPAPSPAPLFERFKITADASRFLRPASEMRDFFGSGGPLYYIIGNYDDPVAQSWRDLGFQQITFEALHIEDPMDRWVDVKIDKKGEVQVDFLDYDRYLRGYLENLNARPFVYLGNIPRALSSKPNEADYSVYAPKSLRKWEAFVRKIVQRNVQKFRLKGLNYGVLGEPDHPDSWKGSGSGNPAKTLEEHIELYAATYRAVKSVDPSAKVGGPSAMSWKKTASTPAAAFELKDWVRALADYNRKEKTGNKAGLDFISWQDYGWAEGGLQAGAKAVSGFLKENGFDAATPKMLAGSGWGSWAGDYLKTDRPDYAQAQAVTRAFIDEFGSPEPRQFHQALYHSFYFNDYWMTPETEKDFQGQRSISLVVIPKESRFRLSPSYAAFQMIHEMLGGQITASSGQGPLSVMSGWDEVKGKFYLLFASTSAKTVVADVVINSFPVDAPVRSLMRTIDEFHSVDGYGLEDGFEIDLIKGAPSAEVSILVKPYAVVLLTFGKQEPKTEPETEENLQKKEEEGADDLSAAPGAIRLSQ